MNVLVTAARTITHTITHTVAHRFSSEELNTDSEGIVTHSWLFPETAEVIWGGLASLIIFGALIKFAGPQIKKFYANRTAKIQKELDGAAEARATAATEAAQIRQAKGDIGAERARLLGEAEAQAAALTEDGHARLAQELADIEAKAMADIAAARGRSGDELRAEIARLSTAAVDHVVTGSLDDATHQELIESFIARVGASK
jgi:F-type H+-transporting ATPase subunit b